MQTLRMFGWLVDFMVGSIIWSIVLIGAAVAAPFVLVGFFIWKICYNTDRFFHLCLPFTPTAIWMMLTDPDLVGRWLVGILLAIISWWIGRAILRRAIHRKLRNLGYV